MDPAGRQVTDFRAKAPVGSGFFWSKVEIIMEIALSPLQRQFVQQQVEQFYVYISRWDRSDPSRTRIARNPPDRGDMRLVPARARIE